MDKKICVKVEHIAHVLRDGIALLPGCRDRQGRPLIVFPSRESPVDLDQIRDVLLYLHEICADDARERGFMIVIDMRGKQTWNNVKPMLKAINCLVERGTAVASVFIINPDRFGEKLKAFSTGFCKFEVQKIAVEALLKYFESSQLIRELGGSFIYSNDDWVETRVEHEKWIWHITDYMRKLEDYRKQIKESQSPVDVPTAEDSIQRHNLTKKGILKVEIDGIQQGAQKVQELLVPCATRNPNPDFIAAVPNLTNLVASLQQLKNEVYNLWDNRRQELETIYQLKMFERDSDQMMTRLHGTAETLLRSMADVGANEAEAMERLRHFEELVQIVDSFDVPRTTLCANAKRLSASMGPMKTRVELAASRVEKDWERVRELVDKRGALLSAAVGFHRAGRSYFGQLPSWLERPGIDPSKINQHSSEQLEEAIQQHEMFWEQVEGVYAEAVNQGSLLTQAQKAAGLDELRSGVMREQMGRLQRGHKQLYQAWKDSKVCLHSLLALIAFQTDTQLVVEWLEEHGEPYLARNIGIGENLDTARNLHRNHNHFQQIAANTYTNADKLFTASRTIIQSGVTDGERMRVTVGDLSHRIKRFKVHVEARAQLLNQSVLFHTHFNELMAWFGEMERRYADRAIDSEVEVCEQSKERWLLESDGTAQAHATTICEGRSLVESVQSYGRQNGTDYTATINVVNKLMGEIDQRNARLTEQWQSRRLLLQVAVKYANYVSDTKEILAQIRNWEEDMREMLESPTFLQNAEKVQPFHRDNTQQVKNAVRNIRRSAHELLQALKGQPDLDGIVTRQGEPVVDQVRLLLGRLDSAENHVMQCAAQTTDRIEAARRFNNIQNLARDMIDTFEREERNLQTTATIPSNLEEACQMQEEHRLFQERVESENGKAARVFYSYSNELIRNGAIDRNAVVDLNENVMSRWRRLVGVTEERNKLLKAAVNCFKTYQTAVRPILEQLEKDYNQSPDRDWCMAKVGELLQERASYLVDLVGKHAEHKEKFLKGCTYAQRTSELFLKYVQRMQPTTYRLQHEKRIADTKTELRERQSRILELWNRKRKQLDRCHRYVLTEAAKQQLMEWMDGEAEAKMARFTRHCNAKLSPEDRPAVLEDFLSFKLSVKSKRAEIQMMLKLSQDLIESDESTTQHVDDIRLCMEAVRQRFEGFSRRVVDCEDALRGGSRPLAQRDELSLDRHSDSNVEERMATTRKEIDSKMREPMRELLKSERDYVDDLSRCCQVYLSDFDTAADSGSLPSGLKDKRFEIFGNIEKVHSFHSRSFLPDVVKYEDDPEQVGCCFTVYVDLINEIYTDYCVNKEQNNHVLGTPEATQFFSSIRERHGLEMKDDLGSLLIKPIQRITRYRLMLEQLMKHCTGNVDEFRDAYEIVVGVPRRANDLIHLNCLDKKDNLPHAGPFVMQDTLTVWEPRQYFKGRGKERQVFLFEMALVLAKRIEIGPKTVRYIAKGKLIQLNEVTVVEHLDVDSLRFGLRIGAVSSNENRVDLRASSEAVKNIWVRRIRELTQGLYKPFFSGESLDGGSLSGRSLSSRGSTGDHRLSRDAESIGSTGGEHRYSTQDTESLGSAGHRFSMQSTSSNEQYSELWTVSVDYDGSAGEEHLGVRRGDRVELIESPGGTSDLVLVALADDPSRQGLVPFSILLPDQPSSSATDRPDASPHNSVVKRKSLRRILSNNKERQSPAPSSSAATVTPPEEECSPSATSANPHYVLTAPAEVIDSEADASSLGLPPPMLDLHVPLASGAAPNGDVTNDDGSQAGVSGANENNGNNGESENNEREKSEMSPQETARMKRQYVLMELVETEKDYVRDLLSVVDGYVANCEMNLPEDLLGKDKIIFANIAQIQEFHQTSFLKEIERCLDDYNAAGQAFVKYERRLHHLYVKYCQNKPKSDYLVAQEQFDQFFAETKLKLGHKVALCDLLIKPVQRIMKYQLLLKDILKFTERAGDSTVVLKKALEVMHVVPKACDDMMQVGRLQNFDGNLTAQGKLIFQGTLAISESVGGKVEKAKDRRIFLFEQSAIIADHIPPKREFGNPTYIFRSQIMVNKMVLDGNVPDDVLRFVIRSSDPSQQASFIAQANTAEEKELYIKALSAQLDQQKTLLAALVDPKRYQSQLAGGIGNMGLEDKKSTASAPAGGSAFGRLGPGASKGSSASKPDSPKHSGSSGKSKGGGLFGFGKKSSAKSPTSPPPVGKLK